MNRKLFKSKLRIAAIALAALQTMGSAASAQDKKPLVFMTWGGVWQQTFDKIAKEYEGKTGQPVSVIVQGAGEAGLARVIAQKGNPEIDLWSTNMINYERAKKAGVLAPFDKAALPNAAKMNQSLIFSHGITTWVSLRGIFYRKDLVPFEPKTWEDLWDPRLKGKIAAPAATFDPGYFPTMAALLAGGNERNLAPGFKKLKELRPNILTFFTNNVQSIRLLESGEVGLTAWGILPNVIGYIKPGGNYGFVVPNKPLLIAETPITLIAGSPRRKEAEAFLNHLLSTDVQTRIAAAFGARPVNNDAKGPEVVESVLTNLEGAYTIDYGYLADHLSDIIKNYDQEVVQ
jgi:putative spermidine/putrescine transport system substrate-binding protein